MKKSLCCGAPMQKENNQCLTCGANGLEKPCPKCQNGTLATMTIEDKIRARMTPARGKDGRYLDKRWNKIIYGCDECKYMEDEDGLPA